MKLNLESSYAQISTMIKKLTDILKKKQEELDAYTEKYNIKPARQLSQEMQRAEEKGSRTKSTGVLA